MSDVLIAGAVGAVIGAVLQTLFYRLGLAKELDKAFHDGVHVGLALKGLHERRGGEE